ncbi:ead/Ea22-like family protein, partial [Serratia sp. IR-2025]
LYSQEYVSALLADNEYMRWRIKEIDLLFGQMLLTMQAAVIEIEHGEGPSAAMQWIVNKLMGPGEFAPDSEKDAQAYFNRESEKIDVEFSKCMDFFESRRKAMKEQSNG